MRNRFFPEMKNAQENKTIAYGYVFYEKPPAGTRNESMRSCKILI